MNILFVDIVHPLLKKELELKGNICDEAHHKSQTEILSIIDNYDGIILRSRIIIDANFLSKCNKLKFIARAGAGLENIDVEYAKQKGISCYNAAEGNRQSVAEHAIGMLLSLFNNLNKSDNQVRKGKWQRECNRGIELANKTIGIIGFGNSGSALAEILKGFNVKILSFDKYRTDYLFKTSMKEIYEKVDIISLHIPLTNETNYLADKSFFNQFYKSIYIINTSRGECVNTKDLVIAIKNKKVLGACLDVLEFEDTSFENLLNDSNKEIKYLINSDKTILSPHIAGWTKESNIKIAKVLLEKITSV